MIRVRRWRVAWLVGALVLGPAAHAIDEAPAFPDDLRQGRYEALTQELRCVVCQSNSIADSNATMAADLRRQVREMIAAGKTDDDIRDYMTARYGEFVLYKPPLVARTVLLWASPVVLMLVGLGAVAVVIVRRSRRPLGDGDGDELIDASIDRSGPVSNAAPGDAANGRTGQSPGAGART